MNARVQQGLIWFWCVGLLACSGKSEAASANPALAFESSAAPANAHGSKETVNTQQASPPSAAEPHVGSPVPAAGEAQPASDFSSPETAMAVLAYAMRTKDVALLLACFARGSAWTSVNTVEKPWEKTKLTYDSLAKGLAPGGDYRGFLFGDDGEDSFRNYFTGPNGAQWSSTGKLRYAPAQPSTEQPTYVQWKKFGPRYVISEIAFPSD